MPTRNAPKPIPPLEELRKILSYDPETGLFRWIGSERKGWNGKIAGCKGALGYIEISTKFGSFLAHRLAWVFIHGDQKDPFEPDHKDQDPGNNRANNLRDATAAQQSINAPRPLPRSGLRGACWDDAHKMKKWRAQIKIDGKYTLLGRFHTPEEAHAAYMVAACKVHGEFLPQ